MAQESQNQAPQPATAAPAPLLEPDFLEEERDLGWHFSWSRWLTFLTDHPYLLNRVIFGLAGLTVLFGLLWWLAGSEEQIAVIPEPAPEAPAVIDWAQQFVGSAIITTGPQHILQQPSQAELLPHTNIAALATTSWQQQKTLLDLYDYDLAANLRLLTAITEKKSLYQQYLRELSKALGNNRALLQLLVQERARQEMSWKQSQQKLAAVQKSLGTASTAATANQASYQQSQVALLTDNIRQLDSWHQILQITHQLATQRLQGTVINEQILLAGLQVTPITDDNLTIIVGGQSTGRGLLARQRVRLGKGGLLTQPNFSQQKITISPTNLKREMINLKSATRAPSV